MGHYDNLRDENCPICGQSCGHCEHTKRPRRVKRAYLISPVRQAAERERKAMDKYVADLEAKGYKVHLPHRDVDQSNDDGGVRICRTHRKSMLASDEVHVWIRPDGTISEGEHFDLGMAFMLVAAIGRKLRFRICGHKLRKTKHKSFTNLLLVLAAEE